MAVMLERITEEIGTKDKNQARPVALDGALALWQSLPTSRATTLCGCVAGEALPDSPTAQARQGLAEPPCWATAALPVACLLRAAA